MATFRLPYLAHRWRDMKNNDDPTGYEFIAEILGKDKETKKTVCWNLVQPFVGEGSPSIEEFEITSVDFENKHLLSGIIDVEFSVDVYFGCDGMDSQHERADTIAFQLDQDKKMILFTVTEQEPRSTFEEF